MTLVIIPARMNSTRLPGKPLLKIGDKTIIERCEARARKAGFEPYVASDSPEIVELFGVRGILTGDCASGTDRVAAAAEIIDPEGKHEFVINYQGDMPFLDPALLKWFVNFTETSRADVATAHSEQGFVNLIPYGGDPLFERRAFHCHIGLYGYQRGALRKFAATPQSKLEVVHSLEQLRCPEEFVWAHLRFPSMPIEINTQADLDRARSCLM